MIPFIEGFAIGLGTIIFVGPVFFLLLNSTLQYGAKAGFAVTLGIIVSDAICVWLCYHGIALLVISEGYKFWIALIGALILAGMGLFYIFKKNKESNQYSSATISSASLSSLFLKGFSVNFFNVFVFLFWTGMYQYGSIKYGSGTRNIQFLIAILVGILGIDIIKVGVAKKLKKYVSSRRLGLFFRLTGILLLIFAVRIMVWLLY